MEYEIKPSTEDDSDLDKRYLFSGFGTQVGDFSYGKQDAANVQVSDMTDIDSSEDDQDSYVQSALYASDFGFDLGVSYSDSQDDSNQATFAAAYTINDLYIAVSYAMGDSDADTEFTSLEAAVQYKFTKEFRMIGIIGQQEEEAAGTSSDTEDFYALEAQYRFNKSIRTYVSYAYNNLDGDDIEDSLVAGIRYNF